MTKTPTTYKPTRDLHARLAATLFDEAGSYRKHDVALGYFEPPHSHEVPMHMQNWERDCAERLRHATTRAAHIETCARIMRHTYSNR